MKMNIAARFAAAKMKEMDEVRCPEIRGAVKGKGGEKIGTLNGHPFRVYSNPSAGWNVLVQFWAMDEDGKWKSAPAPLPGEDVSSDGEDSPQEAVFVTASDAIDGKIFPRWILLEPSALSDALPLRPGWEEPRRFESTAAMEVALFAELDAEMEPESTEGANAYLSAKLPTWADFAEVEEKLFSILVERKGSIAEALSRSAAAREFKKLFPKLVAEAEAKEAKKNTLEFPEGKRVFQTSLFPSLAPGAFY